MQAPIRQQIPQMTMMASMEPSLLGITQTHGISEMACTPTFTRLLLLSSLRQDSLAHQAHPSHSKSLT